MFKLHECIYVNDYYIDTGSNGRVVMQTCGIIVIHDIHNQQLNKSCILFQFCNGGDLADYLQGKTKFT